MASMYNVFIMCNIQFHSRCTLTIQIFSSILCYAMSCYVMSCYAVMLHYIICCVTCNILHIEANYVYSHKGIFCTISKCIAFWLRSSSSKLAEREIGESAVQRAELLNRTEPNELRNEREGPGIAHHSVLMV